MAAENIMSIVEAIEKLTLLELKELVSEIETKFGVSGAIMVGAAVGAGAAGGEAAAAEEKTEFDVVLTSFNDKKMDVIKAVKSLLDLGLKDAKELVESAPKTIKEGVSKEEADKVAEQLTAAGAEVEVK